MKRTLSGALAASLIVGQFQGVVLAETSADATTDTDVSTGNISDSTATTPESNNQNGTNQGDENTTTPEETPETSNPEENAPEVEAPEQDGSASEGTNPDETTPSTPDQGSTEITPNPEEGTQNPDSTPEGDASQNPEQDGSQEEAPIPDDNQPGQDDTVETTVYQSKGKLELDLNFALPIKHVDSKTTNIKVTLMGKNKDVKVVNLGSDVTSGTLSSDINYKLEALNSKRQVLKAGETDVAFYHLTFEGLELGEYSLQVSGAGYQTATVEKIDITKASKRVLLGTSDNKIVLDDKGNTDENDDVTEYYPGAFLAGNVDATDNITSTDYDVLKSGIKSNSTDAKFDLNRDGKVDITDLTYVHQNIDKEIKVAEILDTDLIVNLDNVTVDLDEKTVVAEGVDVKDILKDNGSSVTFTSTSDEAISPENPVSVSLNLASIAREVSKVEQITIHAPSENAPTSGSIVIPGAGENGQPLEVSFDASNIRKSTKLTRDGKSQDEIVVNLGKQVAVSQVSINVTGSRSNKNLTEIAKVEFLNNVYSELPEPNMNIPVINYFTSATAVGNEHLVLGWDHQPNVTGYELKLELLNQDGSIKSTSTYKTSENTLKVEGIEGYSTYRVSIQSLSGDWKSGYKDEQEDYDRAATGATNLSNNSNDKDGLPDNVDTNYNPVAWDSTTGVLSSHGSVENGSNFGADSIVELQVIPETAPEGPEGIVVTGVYKGLNISWKSHKKAKDYDLYYRKVGDSAWIKANDPDKNYEDTNLDNNIPDGVANLKPSEKTDSNELIRGTSYTLTGLDDLSTYEIKMTATNHHGTGGLSQTYLGTTTGIKIPTMTSYKLINTPQEGEIPVSHIVDVTYPAIDKVEHPNGIENKFAVVDNDYKTYWTSSTWNSSYSSGPLVTFDQEYTIDTIRLATRLDGTYANAPAYDYVPVRYLDPETNQYVNINGQYQEQYDPNTKAKYFLIKLPQPITTKQIQATLRMHPSYPGGNRASISEIKFYHYDSLEKDVAALFADNLMLELVEGVTQEQIDALVKRANTIDSNSMEYHPEQKQVLEDLQRAQDLLNDVKLSDNIKSLDVGIRNEGKTIGQSNNYQALGVAVKPGDKVTIYIGSDRANTLFNLAITQHYAESGTAVQTYNQQLVVGKNEITIPESAFNMDYEKGGNLYLSFAKNYHDGQTVQVRVSGGTEVPHLNVNNLINDVTKEEEVKGLIRTYIQDLKTYVNSLPSRYPDEADKTNNIYTYDAQTSILNSTEIEGDRFTLTLAADQVLAGITSGLSTEDEQVERLYDTLLAWEQIMKVSYAQQGLLDAAIDFDGDGNITNISLPGLGDRSEQQFYNDNKAPFNRLNVKYQRMFTGAFMYASSHHVGIGYGSVAGMMQGVPFRFDENGNLVNADEAQLFGWGIGHEIGHVHDVSGLTYAEVTNNILALMTQTFDDQDASRLEGIYEQVYDKVTSGSVGLASSVFVKLGMFWQLHLAYDNDYTYNMLDLNSDNDLSNDTFYAKLYRVTREKGIAETEAGHDRTAQTFVMRASDAVGKDLREFFEKWGIVASPKTNAYLDKQNYPKEDKAIYYLNDEARRIRLKAIENQNVASLNMAQDTVVKATFGVDKDGKQITDKSYLNQNEVPLQLSVSKDNDKILGYEIIKLESTSTGVKESVSGFVARNTEGDVTEYVDVIDTVNNRTFGYKVRAYDYNLNVTEETVLGTVKVSHDGSIDKSDWKFDTNTSSPEDKAHEHSGHGHHEDGTINHIKDNDKSSVYIATKATNHNGQLMSGDPYITIEMEQAKSVVGLKYTPGPVTTTGTEKKFSLKNLFSKSTGTTYSPIAKYEVLVSEDGTNWTKAHSGTFDTTKENTIYFNEAGSSDNTQLWAYNAKYVKLVAKGAKSISVAELDLLGPVGDNIEIGMDNNDQNYQNGVGKLKSDYEYAEGKVIPKDSILVMGEYKGDPAFNVPLVLNENNENFSLEAQAILLATLPQGSQLGEVAEGNWIYWITPDQQAKAENIEGTQVKAELYRYNKLNDQGAPVGQRLVSDTFLVDIDINNLPTIDLTKASRTLNSHDQIIEISSETLQSVMKNR